MMSSQSPCCNNVRLHSLYGTWYLLQPREDACLRLLCWWTSPHFVSALSSCHSGMLVRASMKLTGWGHSIGSGTHTPSISTLPEDGELHTYPPPPTLLLPGGMLHDPAAGHGGPTRPSPRGQRTSPHGDHTASAGASSPQRGGGGGRTVAGWATPDADVAQKLSVGGAGSSCGGDVVPHKRVRLIQVRCCPHWQYSALN